MVALESVQDQGLVRLGDGGIGKSVLVSEVELGRDGSGGESGSLGVHLHVDGLRRLDSDDELVSGLETKSEIACQSSKYVLNQLL